MYGAVLSCRWMHSQFCTVSSVVDSAQWKEKTKNTTTETTHAKQYPKKVKRLGETKTHASSMPPWSSLDCECPRYHHHRRNQGVITSRGGFLTHGAGGQCHLGGSFRICHRRIEWYSHCFQCAVAFKGTGSRTVAP